MTVCVLRVTPISCSCNTEIAENQTQNLILELHELQCKLSSKLGRVFTFKGRELIGKKWYLLNYDVGMCEDP